MNYGECVISCLLGSVGSAPVLGFAAGTQPAAQQLQPSLIPFKVLRRVHDIVSPQCREERHILIITSED